MKTFCPRLKISEDRREPEAHQLGVMYPHKLFRFPLSEHFSAIVLPQIAKKM